MDFTSIFFLNYLKITYKNYAIFISSKLLGIVALKFENFKVYKLK